MKFLRRSFLLVLLVLLVPSVHATSSQAYQDYLYQFDVYRTKYTEFRTAKNEYEKFHSLTSQTTALTNTTAMLVQRNTLLRSYLLLLDERISENPGLNDHEKAQYHRTINTEMKFFDGNNSRIAGIGNLEDAQATSRELETHNKALQTVIRQTITGISLGSLTSLTQQFDAGFSEANNIVSSSRTIFPPQKQATIDRWLQQIQHVRDLYQQNVEEIGVMNTKLSERSIDGLDDGFRSIKNEIVQAKTYIQEGNRFLGELIEALRYQN